MTTATESTKPPGTEFMSAFNAIENHVRRTLGEDERASLKKMLGVYQQRARLQTEHVQALHAMIRLRNAISHGQYLGGRPIAEPLPETVAEISRLRDLILRPPLVRECLEKVKVSVATPDMPIRTVLDLVHRYDYSQMPVYGSGRYLGLLTTNAIARWLADRLDTVPPTGSEQVKAVLEFAEPRDRALLVPKDITANEAIDLLSHVDSDGSRPAALVMTRTGGPDGAAIAVVVDFDLPALNRAIALLP